MKSLLRLTRAALLMTTVASALLYQPEGTSEFCMQSVTQVEALSKIFCAVRCHQAKCAMFRFQDGMCYLYNTGSGSAHSERLYRQHTGLINVAGSMPTTASPHYDIFERTRANDCSHETDYHSLKGEVYPWYNIDLGSPLPIFLVRIFPTAWSPAQIVRFRDVEVSVGMNPAVNGDNSGYTFIGEFQGPFQNVSNYVDFSRGSPIEARYVHVKHTTIIHNDFLNIQEIQVLSNEYTYPLVYTDSKAQ